LSILLHPVAYCWLLRAKMTSYIKPEVHNVSLRRQKRTEPRPYVTRIKSLVKIGRVFTQICSRTDKHTDRQTRPSQYYAVINFSSPNAHSSIEKQQGCSPKKEVVAGGTPETRLRQRFLNNLGLHTRTLIHVREIATADLWFCPAIQLLLFECL